MSEPSFVNNGPVDKQVNIGSNYGPLHIEKMPSRWAVLFSKLKYQITSETRRSELLEELQEYKTKLDGTKGLEEKLTDGNVPDYIVRKAIRQKEKYAKKAERFSCYEAAQYIDLELFAIIKDKFDTYIYPQIVQSKPIVDIMTCVSEDVVIPIIKLVWDEGANDEYLLYNLDTIYGMVYYLTGMCHLNWKDYDNI